MDKVVYIVLVCMLIPVHINAQDVVGEMVEDGSVDEDKVDNNIQELDELKDNPINLNAATKEKFDLFVQHGLLTDKQAQAIQYYLYYHQMVTVNELMLVYSMDRQTVLNLLPYVCVRPVDKSVYKPNIANMLKYGKNELLARTDIPLYQRKGYANGKYLGDPYYQSIRYGYHYKDKVYFGFAGEKDEGEPLFTKNNSHGYDYTDVYIYVHNLGIIKDFSFGDYSFSCGQGLLINTGYSLGKSTAIDAMDLRSTGIRKHASTDENNYLQGTALTMAKNSWQYTFLYSNRLMDGIIKNGTITSIQTTGLHRTSLEIERKNDVRLQLFGTHVAKQFKYGEIGATGLYYFFDRYYSPTQRRYNTYYLRGKDFYNIGVDYKYHFDRLTVSGELGIGDNNHLALINNITYHFNDSYQLLFINRSYSKKYHAYYASSIAEGGMVMNETGYLLGLQGILTKSIKASTYFDYFNFPYLKYDVDKSSHGFDYLLKFTYTPTMNWMMGLRYQHKEKMRNVDSKSRVVSSLITDKLSYQLIYQPNKLISLQGQISGIEQHFYQQTSKYGYLIAGRTDVNFKKWRASFDMAMFHTDDYNTRIYMYERGLLYAFSFSSYYGCGLRSSFTSYYQVNKHLLLITKYGLTHFFDRNRISSGSDMINGSNKNDVYLQIRYKF